MGLVYSKSKLQQDTYSLCIFKLKGKKNGGKDICRENHITRNVALIYLDFKELTEM